MPPFAMLKSLTYPAGVPPRRGDVALSGTIAIDDITTSSPSRILAQVQGAGLWQALLALRGADVGALAVGARLATDGRLACALADAMLGRVDEAQAEAKTLQAEASTSGAAGLVCDAVATRALASAISGDLVAATDLARRASMMSRTEAMREQEILANVILARVRRLTGRPFLATRILSAVLRFATEPWQPLVAWELAMAGGAPAEPRPPACHLYDALTSARRGDREAFECSLERALVHVGPLVGHAADVRAVRAALDPNAEATPVLERWRCGQGDIVPLGLLGLAASAPEEGMVLVVARPNRPGARVLDLGGPLVEAQGATRLAKTQRRQGRTDTALAVLALAGPAGLPEEELFRASYGFAFSRNVHRGVLDVLLHRARAHVGEAGEIVRSGGGVAMTLCRSLLLVDPRCSAHDDNRVLQLVAMRGRMTAKETSLELGMPLRSAQAALEALIATGACIRERSGRTIAYRVDDTTFQEPTGL
jgi:hypothetical protein